jgi:glycosyltransferase involved in cell wall biosynthesis
MEAYNGRLAIQQRVLPYYRAAFFDTLAEACRDGLSVYAGQPRPEEAIEVVNRLDKAVLEPGSNRHFFSGPAYLCRQAGLTGWLERWQPTALVVEANPRYLSTPAAVKWMRTRSRPVIGWGLGSPPLTGFLPGIRSAIRKRFLAGFDALITYSRQGAEEYQAAGFPAEKVIVARNAVTHRPAQPMPERAEGYAGAPVVLFVGRLQARKRVDTLLKACGQLPETLRPEVWIVGDGPAREEFEACARVEYPRARFFGSKRGAELDALFQAADLFVLPGTGGLAVQQAMSQALPVVVGEADGTQADLVRPENGWLTPPGDAGVLHDRLADALSDPPRLRRMGAASFRIVAEEINLENMVESFLEALK